MVLSLAFQEYNSSDYSTGSTSTESLTTSSKSFSFQKYMSYSRPIGTDLMGNREVGKVWDSNTFSYWSIQLLLKRTGTLSRDLTIEIASQDNTHVIYSASFSSSSISTALYGDWFKINLPKWVMSGGKHILRVTYTGFYESADDNTKNLEMWFNTGSGSRYVNSTDSWQDLGYVPLYQLANKTITLSPTGATNLNFAKVDETNVAEGTNPVKRGTNSYTKNLRFKWTNNNGYASYVKGPRLYRSDANALPTGVTLKASRTDTWAAPTTAAVGSNPPTSYSTGIKVHDYDAEQVWQIDNAKSLESWWWIRLQMQVAADATLGRVPASGEIQWTLQWDEW